MSFFEDELNAADLGGEAGDDDAAVGVVIHDAAEVFPDVEFGVRVLARRVDVGGFVDKKCDAFFFGDFVNACVVSLDADGVFFVAPVAGEVNEAVGSADDDGGVAGDGVESVDELYGEVFADLDVFVAERVDGDVVEVGLVVEFGYLFFNHADGELGSVNRGGGVELWQEMAASADVVEVGVSEENGFDVVFVVF